MIKGAGPMVEKSSPTNTFALTRLIGGKLRALFDEEVQPCSSRMADLLETLASAKPESAHPKLAHQETPAGSFPHLDQPNFSGESSARAGQDSVPSEYRD